MSRHRGRKTATKAEDRAHLSWAPAQFGSESFPGGYSIISRNGEWALEKKGDAHKSTTIGTFATYGKAREAAQADAIK